MTKIEKQIRPGLPMVGVPPYGQVHAHSTGNRASTAQNEADYMGHKDINTGFYTHVVGNGRIIQVANVNRGAWDVGGGWNQWGYASVELIESHKTKEEFMRDYKIYVTLLRDLAKEAKIPLTLDQGNMGVITHDYARRHQPYNQTNHVDPYPYLAKWGITQAQFRKDIENGADGTVTITPAPSDPAVSDSNVKTWNIKQTVDVDGLAVRTAQNTGATLLKRLNKGHVFNATRMTSNGQAVTGNDGKSYKTWFEVEGSGWVSGAFVTPVATSTPTSTTPSKPAATAPTTGKWWSEKGKFYIGEATPGATNANIKSLPLTVNATGNGAKIADIAKGNYIQYDMAMNDGKYIWIRQPRGNGKFGYMATGNVKNGKRVDYWGRFK